MLSVLHDPLTRLERDSARVAPRVAPRAGSAIQIEQTADGVLLVKLSVDASLDAADSTAVLEALRPDPARVVLDLREVRTAPSTTSANARLNDFVERTTLMERLTVGTIPVPTERVRRIGNAEHHAAGRAFAEGKDAWLLADAATIAGVSNSVRRVAVVVNRGSALPRAIMALVSAGRATLVFESSPALPAAVVRQPDEASLVSSVRLAFAPGLTVRVRTGELLHTDGSVGIVADTLVPPPASAESGARSSAADSAPALRAALHVVRTGKAPRAKRAMPAQVPPAILPVTMDSQNYPSMGARLLAGFRLWSAMRARHVHRDLYDDDLDATLLRVIPRLEAARNEQQYAAAIGDLASTMDDAAGVLVGPSFQTWLGTSVAPFRVRMVEGRAIITDLVRDSATNASGLSVGTEVLAADGFPLSAWLSEHRRIGPVSNEWTRSREQMRVITRGPEGAALFKLRDATNRERSLELPRRATYVSALPIAQRADAAAARMLDGGIAYIDLERWSDRALDSVLTAMYSSRALVLDARAGASTRTAMQLDQLSARLIARLATQPSFMQWREVHRHQSAPCVALAPMASSLRDAALRCPDERTQVPVWTTVDTAGHYRGRIVVLIDERTDGAMERLTLAVESAASVTLIGSTSAGAPSPTVMLELPGSLAVGVSLVEIRRADGGQVQRVGITPAIEIRPTVRGLRNRQDEVMDRAQQWLVQQLDPPARRKR